MHSERKKDLEPIDQLSKHFKDLARILIKEIHHMQAAQASGLASEWISASDVAKRYPIDQAEIYRALNSGELPCIRRPGRGGKLKNWIKIEDAERWFIEGAKENNLVKS